MTLLVDLRLAICAILFCSLSSAQDSVQPSDEVSGIVKAVTLYRDRALVTREIPIESGKQLRVISVPDLPELAVAESTHAEGDENVIVHTINVSSLTSSESNREELRRLDKRLEELDPKRSQLQHKIDVLTAHLETLQQLVNFTVSSAPMDLNRGVLDASTLTELATFSMTERGKLTTEQFEYRNELKELDKQIQQVTTAQRDLAARSRRTRRHQAKILVESQADRAGTVRLHYHVNGCGWSPQYTLRANSAEQTVEIRLNANVYQQSGENWDNVELVLSTASPTVNAARPLLTPLEVGSTVAKNTADQSASGDPFAEPFGDSAVEVAELEGESLPAVLQTLQKQRQHAEAMFTLGDGSSDTRQRDLTLNSLGGLLQQIELQIGARSLRKLAPDVNVEIAGQSYELSQRVSFASRSQQQHVQIVAATLESLMYHVATPLLSTYAYRESDMTNTLPIGLIAGPATVYLNDRFVGHTHVPSTASGQRLVTGFGADQQVRTRRELIDKHDLVQGGNRLLKFDYRLVLSNFKDEPVVVRLMDRMPNTRQSQQLSLQLDGSEQPLSVDGLYLRVLRPTGILRWDVTVPAGRNGSQAMDVNYSYSMEFDRHRIPVTNHTLDDLQAGYQNVNFGGLGGGGFGGGGGN